MLTFTLGQEQRSCLCARQVLPQARRVQVGSTRFSNCLQAVLFLVRTNSLTQGRTLSFLTGLSQLSGISYAPTLLRSYAPTLLRSYAPTLLRSYAPTLLRSYAPTLLRSYAPHSALLVKNDLLDPHNCKPLSGKKRCRTLCYKQDLLCTTNSFLKTVISKCFVSFCHSMNLVPFTYSISCVFGSIYKLICYL